MSNEYQENVQTDVNHESAVSEPTERETIDTQSDTSTARDKTPVNYEEQARKKGWRPQEEFAGDPEEWVSAKEYMGRREILDKLHESRQEIKELKKGMGGVHDLIRRREEIAVRKALEQLQTQRTEAIQNGDVNAVETYDKNIKEAEREIENIAAPKERELSDEAKEWIEERKSQWINYDNPENAEMSKRAIQIEQHLSAAKPYLTDRERLNFVEQEIKALYPHRFKTDVRPNMRTVESDTGRLNGGKKSSLKITSEMKEMADRFVRLGTFKTRDEYYKLLEESN
jgi:hypothetical protein